MVDKKVQFNVVVGGIPQLKSALKGVTDSARSMNLSIQQMGERTAQRLVELERNKLSAIKRINDSQVADEEAKARRIVQIEENASRQITSIKERENLRIKHMNEKYIQDSQAQAGQKLNLGQIGHIASSSGFSKTGQILRIANQLGIGSKVSSGGGGSAVAAGVEGVEGAAAGVGGAASGAASGAAGLAAMGEAGIFIAGVLIALAPLIVTAKLVEIGFESVSAQAKLLATSFIGAIAQIGGAKNLQETLVHAAESEKVTKTLRMAVLPEERASEKELGDMTAKLAANPKLGAFDSNEWKKAIDILGVGTGEQKSFLKDPSTLEFIGNMAHLRNMPLDQMANLYGEIKQQNPTFSHGDVQQTLLRGTALGRKTSFDITDIPQAKTLMTQSVRLSGDRGENIQQLLGIGAILKPYAEGGMLGAGIETQAILGQAYKSHRQGNDFGFKYDKAGRVTNLRQGLAFSVAHHNDLGAPKTEDEIKANKALMHLSAAAGVTEKDTTQQQYDKVMKLLEANDGLTMSMKQLSDESTETISTQDRLKAEFNKITDQMGTALLPVLKELVPYVETFGKTLIENKELITEAIKLMISAMIELVPITIMVGGAIARLGIVFGMVMQALAMWVDTMTGGVLHDSIQPIIDAGDQISKSQAALAVTLDNLGDAFDKLKKKVAEIKVPEASNVITIPEVKIVGDAHNKEVVRAIENMHHDIKINKQPL
jgi:hypothetical protein